MKRITSLFNPEIVINHVQDGVSIEIYGPLTFAGYLKVKNLVTEYAAQNQNIIINLSNVTYLDHTASKKLQRLKDEFHFLNLSTKDNQELVRLYNHQVPRIKRIA